MPCFLTGSAEGDLQLSLREAHEAATQATRVACELAGLIRKRAPELMPRVTFASLAWLNRHEKIDAQRRDAEVAKKRKATPGRTAKTG